MDDMTDTVKVINYSNIFLSCITEQGCGCRYKVRYHSLIYVRSGEVDIDDRGTHTLLHAGECAYVRRNAGVFMTKRSLNDGHPYLSITLSFPRRFLMDYFHAADKSRIPQQARRTKSNVRVIEQRPDIRSLFESIIPYQESGTEPDAEWIDIKLREGLRAVLKTDENLYASLFDFNEPWKIDILEYLNENYMYDIPLDEMAQYTGRSTSTFKRDFKKVSDLTPQRWVTRRRLERAHELLAAGRRRVSDVMNDVGFNNISHFSRIFKKMYGLSPSALAEAATSRIA